MQVIYKSVRAFKNCEAVFRSHSSGALPVLAITGYYGMPLYAFLLGRRRSRVFFACQRKQLM